MRRIQLLLTSLCYLYILTGCQKELTTATGSLKITFINKVAGSPMVLNSMSYTNPFNESYNITKFRYYVTNIRLYGPTVAGSENNSYHLVDQADPSSLSFFIDMSENAFTSLVFVLGVDSTRNVSGAQTGALDPLNDMFWTWNSGYVMAKMEGTSPQSTVAGNMVEYHIGGFSGPNNVLKTIDLSFPGGKVANVKKGHTSEIIVEADFNTWWQSPNNIQIATLPVCSTPGASAKKIADNYSKMFSIQDVINK